MAHVPLFHDLAPDYLERRPGFRDAHLALAWTTVEGDHMMLGGSVGDLVESALLLFTYTDAARAFAGADPM